MDELSKAAKINVYIDGGSRGNPGPAAFGVVFTNEKEEVIKEYAECLGIKTNNEAEYSALIFALKKLKAILGGEKTGKVFVEIKTDSELMARQMNGEYKIKNPEIQKLFLEAWNLKTDFKNLKIALIPRSENKRADFLVNKALDQEKKNQKLF